MAMPSAAHTTRPGSSVGAQRASSVALAGLREVLLRYLSALNVEMLLGRAVARSGLSPQDIQMSDVERMVPELQVALKLFCRPDAIENLLADLRQYVTPSESTDPPPR
ncbi:MAG: hypothetical protein AB2A00_30530 [Myxococcota bacterium]